MPRMLAWAPYGGTLRIGCILQPWLYCDTVSGCGGPVPVSFVASISVSGTVNAWDTPHRGQQLCKPLSHIHRG
ncbi:hypothetical protein HaLaN_15428, partial [Haematococcus lacustris]